jgi:hypothetical protein
MLEQDAMAEARLAMQADGAFSLPRSLFPGDSFGTFFESCRGN